MGAIQELLERELREEIAKRGTVVWLDKDGHYGAFVDGLTARAQSGAFPFHVVGFRGSYLELMLKLKEHNNDLDRDRLLVHMPGHNESTIKETPVLELYQPGYRFRKALPTLVREAAAGRVDPATVDAFATGAPSLEEAEQWLAAQLETPEGLGKSLQRMQLTAVVDALSTEPATLLGHGYAAEDVDALMSFFHRSTGIDSEWIEHFPLDGVLSDDEPRRVDRALRALCSWALCAEYVHDLRGNARGEMERFGRLTAPLAKASRGLAEHLRVRHAQAYENFANETEGLFEADLAAAAEVLGDIDTFRFEESTIRSAAIASLLDGKWEQTSAWATQHRVENAFWLRGNDDPVSMKLRWTWAILKRGAELGQGIDGHREALKGAHSLRDALERYTGEVHRVDQLHRHFEQVWREMGDASLPDYTALREAVRQLRRLYRAWTDELARAFNQLCGERGFLPEPALQQRTLFESVVHPLVGVGESVALFLVDAMRYEMAAELAPDLAGDGALVDLKARFAELPTITSVGMNALAPVSREGKLDVVLTPKGFGGFRSSEFVVSRPAHRARAMGSRSVKVPARELSLAEVCDMPLTKLKAVVKKAPGLLVVHSLEIDGAGEAGVGLATFAHTLRQIRTAAHQLQAAGVGHIVITADHGFLLRDEDAPSVEYGDQADRRHILAKENRQEAGTVSVSLADLGYRVDEPRFLIFRDDTQVYVTRAGDSRFVHGGNTLEERVIPVLVLRRKRKRGAPITAYRISAEERADMLGRRRLRLRLDVSEKSTATLDFAGARHVTLELRAVSRPDVTVSIAHVDGPAKHVNGRLEVPVGRDWSDILFQLEGEHDKPAHIEIVHPDATEDVAPVVLKRFFSVTQRDATTAKAPVASNEERPTAAASVDQGTWRDAIEDEGFRKVFVFLAEHGSITEADLAAMLGNARRVRRFARQFDTLRSFVPFAVRVVTIDNMKSYVKDGAS